MAPLILTVEDEPNVAELIRIYLEGAGYEVVTAGTVQEALDLIEKRRPELIVSDLMLPDIDGFGLFELLRARPDTADVPVVMVTGWESPEARAVGLELGAAAYLNKPFKPQELVDCVGAVLGRRPLRGGVRRSHGAPVTPGR